MEICQDLYGFFWNSSTANNCNSYLIDGPGKILIDPGHLGLFHHVESGLRQLGIGCDEIGLIICTHAHPDHMEALLAFESTRALWAIHENEWHFLKSIQGHLQQAMGIDLDRMAPDFLLKEGDLDFRGTALQVLDSPGHSPGGLCLYWPDRKAAFTGDTIFHNGLGRTDLPGGDGALLKKSIQRLSLLSIERLLPGHGQPVLGSAEVNANFKLVQNNWFGYV